MPSSSRASGSCWTPAATAACAVRACRVRGPLGALLLADAGVKTWVFGNPLPLPFYAKRGDFYAGYIGAARWNPVYATQDFLRYQAPCWCCCADRGAHLLAARVAVPFRWRRPSRSSVR